MWNSIVSVPDHCLFIYFTIVFVHYQEEEQAKAKEKTAAHTTDETKEKADDYKQSWPQNRLNKDQKHFDVEKL